MTEGGRTDGERAATDPAGPRPAQEPESDDGPRDAQVFETWRGRMFGVAYRMLGTASEAEDIVQDAYLRWQRADRDEIAAPGAWLTKTVTRLCLNHLASARVRREQYVGQWLPEPVLTGLPTAHGTAGPRTPPDALHPLGPLETAEQREAVSLALLVLLERLSPPERAVFVLREAFGYPHREIADVLEITEAGSRQLYRRGKRALPREPDAPNPHPATDPAPTEPAPTEPNAPAAKRPAPTTTRIPPTPRNDLLTRFLAAAREGDLGALEELLAADVVSYADGGGKVNTARRPVVGRAKVARYLLGGLVRFVAGVEMAPAEVNGAPAFLAMYEGRLMGVLALEVADGRVTALRITANPDKMVYVERQLAAVSHPGGRLGQ